MKLYIVQEQQSEGGWGFANFDAEIYKSEQKACERCENLNKEKPDYCGYYYEVVSANLID